ncbi:MAG: PKD-like domain-containing protein [Cyclobacteriaceae bacterium]
MARNRFNSLLIILPFLFSLSNLFAQNATSARHDGSLASFAGALNQDVVEVRFDVPVTFSPAPSTAGFTIEVNGTPLAPAALLSATSVAADVIRIQFDARAVTGNTIERGINVGNTLRVRYTSGAGNLKVTAGLANVNTFNLLSQNNAPPDCTDFIYKQQGEFDPLNVDICDPVRPTPFYEYYLSKRYRNSTAYNANNAALTVRWQDPATTVNIYRFSETYVDGQSVLRVNPNNQAVLFGPANFNYPATDAVCSYTNSFYPIFYLTNPNCPIGALVQSTTFISYARDNENTGALVLTPSPLATSNLVCIGNNANVSFEDNTNLNCRAGVGLPNSSPNEQTRWVRFLYGFPALAPAATIPNVVVNGVPLTDAGGNYIGPPGGYYVTGPGGPNNEDFVGVVELPANVTTTPEFTLPVTTSSPVGQIVGQRFNITMQYWNVCNKYSLGTPTGSIDLTNFVEIITKPNAPVATNKEYCFTEVIGSGGNCGAPTGEFFEVTSASVAGSTEIKWYNSLTDANADINPIASGYGTNCRFLRPENRAGGVAAMAAAGVYSVFVRYRTGAAPPNDCMSDPVEVRITRRSSLSPPGPISPLTSDVCDGLTNVPYSLASSSPVVPFGGLTEYSWTFSGGAGASVDAPNTTQNITADFSVGGSFITTTRNLEVRTRFTTNATTGGRCTTAPSTRTVTIYGPTVGGTASGGTDYCQGVDANDISLSGQNGSIVRWEVDFNSSGFVDAGVGAVPSFDPGVLAPGNYVYRAVVGNGPCAQQNSSTTTINVFPTPTTATAGVDQNLCQSLVTPSAPLGGNVPVTGTGVWSQISGPGVITFNPTTGTANATATASAQGIYVVRWTISTGAGSCSSFENVTLDFGAPPAVPDAGPAQDICASSTNLNGTVPTFETGTWSVSSAPGAGTVSFSSTTSPTATVSLTGAMVYGTYTLRWRFTSGTCAPTEDLVNITFRQAPTATAPADFTFCVDNPPSVTIPLSGTFGGGASNAHWEVVSGTGSLASSGGAIGSNDATNPVDDVYNPTAADFAAGSIQVQLVTDDPVGNCVASSDLVTITIDRRPTAANAGPDFATCDATTNLAATAANNGGTGTWSVGNALYYETFTYPNGTGLSGPNPHAALFTHGSGWTITAPNGNTLLANDDYLRVESNVMEARDVNDELVWRSPSINITALPNISISLQLMENNTSGNMEPDDHIRAFYSINGGVEVLIGGIDDDGTDGVFTTVNASGLSGNTLEIIVRVDNDAADEFHRFDNIFVSSGGAVLPLIADINNPTTSVSNLPVGTTTFTWTVTSALGVCSSSNAQVDVTRHATPVNNNQTPALCEDVPTGGTATVTLAFLSGLNDAITGIPGSTGRTIQFFTDPARTIPYPASASVANTDVVYTTVTRTDVSPNCTTNGTVTFTINSRPAALDQSPEYCEDLPVGSNTKAGINLTLLDNAVKNGVVANTVAWFSDATLTIPVPDPTNVTANGGDTFFARVTDGNGCTDDATIDIQLNPIPSPNALIGPTNVCVSASAVNLYQLTTTNPGFTYTWTIPDPPFDQVLGGGANDFLLLLSFPVIVNPGQDISVIETSDKGCVGLPNTLNITVEGSPPPITILDASASAGPGSVCENEAGVVFTVANLANTTYAWTVPPGSSIIAGQGTNQITVNFGTIGGLISVLPTTSTGCAGNPDDYSVAINPRPSLDPLSNTVCSDSPSGITLSGTGAVTFNITNVTVPPGLAPASRPLINGALPNEIVNDIFTNTTGGSLTVQYTVVPVSASGCQGAAQIVNLTIRPEPVLAPGLNDVICSTTDAVGIVLSVASGSFPADQYEVFAVNNPSGLVPVAGNPTTLGVFTSSVLLDDKWENTTGAPATIEYFIRPINSGTGCVGDPPIGVLVTVNPEPVVAAMPPETICSGDSPATIITPSIAGSTFTWTVVSVSGLITGNTNGTGPSGSAITDVLINNGAVAGSVTYAITPTGPAGVGSCSGQSENLVVNVNPSPTANSISQTVCSDTPGGNTFAIDLTTLENTVNSGGGITFTWSENISMVPPIATPSAYTLTNGVPVFVEVDNGQCTKVATVLYTINPSPSVVATITSNYNGFQLSCNGASDGQITAIPANGTGPYLFSIDGGGAFFTSGIFNGLSVTGNPYTIRVRDTNGCIVDSAPLTLVPPTPVSATAAITSNYNGEDVSCQAASDGIITVTPAGGTGTYTFRLLELPSNTTGDATGIYTGLRAGSYTFVVTDANNCQFTTPTITVTEPSPVTANAVLTSPVSCNGNSDGVITVTAAGGTLAGPSYTFTLVQPPGTINATGVFNGLAAGNYTVNVRDDNGCIRTSNTVSVTQPSVLTAFASVTSNYNGAKISCPGANDAVITAIANGGNGGYSYVLDQDLGNLSGAATGVFTNVGPGTYTVTVTDAGTCTVTSASVTITDPTPIVASAIITGTISCNGGSDGQITVSALGGTGAYSFEQINPAGPTNGTGIFSGLAQGTYDFEVTDLNGCADVVTITINEPTLVTASSAVTSNYNGAQISCNGASNGVITVTAAGGTGSLTYVFDQFVLTNTTGQFTGVFTGVPAGVGYTFTVRDSKNCTVVTLPVNVTEPTVVAASGTVTSNYNGEDISCVGSSDGQITVTANGGTGTYTYKLDQVPSNTTGDVSGIYTGLSAGIYTVTARDVNNCFIVTAPITITSPIAITASAAVTSNYNGRQVSCNGASDGIITVTASGGVGGFTYVLSPAVNATGAATGVFTGLPAGTYTVTVTDLNNCQRVTTAVTISEPAVVAATATVTSNFNGQQISCNGASDGTITVSASGGTLPYTYAFVEIPGNTSGLNSGIFTGVPAGTYTFNVLDVNNCPVTTTPVTITPPTPVIGTAAVTSNYNGSQVSCNGVSDGVITITASGGTGLLQYTFDQIPGNTTGQFSGIFSGVPAGVGYTFTIRDANNCTVVTAPINVTEPLAVAGTGVVSSNYNGEDISCFGSSDGQITITASNGTGAYTYKLDQAPSNTSGDANGIYTGLSAGTYTVTVRDANGCFVVTPTIMVTSPTLLTASGTVTSNYNGRQITCNGASDGVITVSSAGGVPAYAYLLNEIPGNTTGAASGVFSNVPAGSYTITVTDLNACQRITSTIVVSEPSVLAAASAITSNYNGEDVSCNGSSDGIIKVTPTGGTTPYAYTFVEIPANTSGATTGTFTGIPAGSYTFNVVDVNNCPVTTVPIVVNEPTPVTASAVVTSNYNGSQISCNGLNDGVITITSGGGTGTATYVFDQFAVANQSGRFSGIFTSVPAGTGYTFTVRDANNCPVVTTPVDVTAPGALNATGTATSDFNGFDVRCFTETNGQITVTAAGGTGTLEYMLLEDAGNMTGLNSGVFDNIRAGSFRARITDDNGCLFTTTPIAVTQPNSLTVTINKTSNYNGFDVSCIGASDGEVSVITTGGGAGGYTYALDGFPGNTTGQATGVFTGVASGLYTITVTDVNTCTRQSLPVILTDPLPLFEGIVGLDKSVCLGGDPTAFTQLAPVFGGIGNYTYQWRQSTDNVAFSDVLGANAATFDPPAVPQTTYYKRQVTSGTCATLESNTVTVTVNPLPTATLAPSKSPVCEGDFFLLEFTFTGQAPFFFDYNDGTTFTNDRLGASNTPVPVLNYTNTTTYTVTEVRDFNGCVAPVLPAPVTVPVIKINPNFTITSPAAQCSGGVFNFDFTVDPDVDYTWTWGDGQTDVIPANSLPAGTQSISHTYTSMIFSGTSTLPVILTAINNVQGCGPKQTNQSIQIYPNILINLVPDANEICGGDDIRFNNLTQGGTTHHWFYREQGVVEMRDERTFVAASTQTFVFNNTTTQNPITYELVYEVSNANCAADTVIEVMVYREVAAAFDKGVVPPFVGGIANMTFTNISVPIDGAEFLYEWDFGNASDTPPTSGIGPFNINYTSPGTKTVTLVATNLIAQSAGLTCFSQYQETFDILLPPLLAAFEYIPQGTCFPANISITENFATGDQYTWRLFRSGQSSPILISNDTLPTFRIVSPGRYMIFLETRNSITGQTETANNLAVGNNTFVGDSNPNDFSTPIDIYDVPFAMFEALPTTIFVPDEELRTFNSSISPTDPQNSALTYPIDYRWYFGDGTDTVFSEFEPRHFYQNEGNYDVSLIAFNDHGNGVVCADTMIQRVTAKAQGFTRVPNAFTPNPSGPTGGFEDPGSPSRNDVFLPIMKGIKEFKMQIFDRWGNLVFQSTRTDQGWDGYDRNGNLMPAGVYVYKLELRLANDQRTTQVGDVTLIR